MDYKFLLVPVVFIILRIWTCISVFVFIYIGIRFEQVPETVGTILLNLSVSYGVLMVQYIAEHGMGRGDSRAIMMDFKCLVVS